MYGLIADCFDREPVVGSISEAMRLYDEKNPNDPNRLRSRAQTELGLRKQLGIRQHDA